MRKSSIILLIIITLITLAGCKSTNERIIEETNAQDVSMESYGIEGANHFKKITAEKLIELMNVKEGEEEYNIFVGNPNDPWSKEAVKRIENSAESIEKDNNFSLMILYVPSTEIEANEEIYNAYFNKTSLYAGGEFRTPAMFKLCDGYVWSYQSLREEEEYILNNVTLGIVYGPLSKQTINEVIIPYSKGEFK